MQYGNVWITKIKDCGDNKNGYYCQVYSDSDLSNEIDSFCIHPDDCNCSKEEEVEAFIKHYAQQYQ